MNKTAFALIFGAMLILCSNPLRAQAPDSAGTSSTISNASSTVSDESSTVAGKPKIEKKDEKKNIAAEDSAQNESSQAGPRPSSMKTKATIVFDTLDIPIIQTGPEYEEDIEIEIEGMDSESSTTIFSKAFSPYTSGTKDVTDLAKRRKIKWIFPKGKENLGPYINSEYGEYNPIISPDGKSIFFCRDKHPDNTEGEYNKSIFESKRRKISQDIWYSETDANGNWIPAVNVGPPLNNIYPNFVTSVTPDGNTLLIGGMYKYRDAYQSSIFTSHRTYDGWSEPQLLNIQNLNNRSRVVNYTLSNNGKILLMQIERRDTYGETDIYVSFRIDDTLWTEPLNLGPSINTDSAEFSPFLAADGVSLYFSSKGHGGYGKFDVFLSRRLDDSWEIWSTPQNLGDSINTPGNDYYYKIDASGSFAYFTSYEDSYGKADVFRTKLPDEMKPKPVALMSGKVFNNRTQEPVDARIYYEILPEGVNAGIARSNPKTGEYKLIFPTGKRIGFHAEADGFVSIHNNFNTEGITEYSEFELDLELVPIEKGAKVQLKNIFFEYNSERLDSASYPELKRVAKFMKENPKITIEVAGYTDDKGSKSYNLKLSRERAQSVRQFLIDMDVEGKRIAYKGYGEANPIATNKTDEGRRLNRRVEFIILSNE